jgi:hypothetical protein
VAPALAAEPGFAGLPSTGAGFVFRELANVLAHAGARQRSGAAAYLSAFAGDVPSELPRLLARAFGRDDNVWLEAGCSLSDAHEARLRSSTNASNKESHFFVFLIVVIISLRFFMYSLRGFTFRLIRFPEHCRAALQQ